MDRENREGDGRSGDGRRRSPESPTIRPPRPPRIPEALLNLALPPREGYVVTGDLNEEYRRHVRPRKGRLASHLWYWRQALGSVLPSLRRRWRRGDLPMESLLQDLRHAARGLRRQPGFTAVAVLTLTLGIGANTAIFSVVSAVTLEPLPFAEPDELVLVLGTHVRDGQAQTRGLSYPDFRDLREQVESVDEIVAQDGLALNVMAEDTVRQEPGERVSAGYFALLGTEPALGRSFRPEDDRPGAEPVAVVGRGFFEEHFGGDPGRLGETLVIDQRPHTVVGVMPASFGGINLSTRLWVPFEPTTEASSPGDLERRDNRDFAGIGRLRSDADLARLSRELDELGLRLASAYPDSNRSRGFQAQPLRDSYLGTVGSSLWILLGAVGCLLLVACANVASLVLARAESRRKEIAMRVALGAGRGRVARQVLAETLLLALLAGAAGLLTVAWTLDALVGFIPAGLLPSYVEIGVDGTVLAFSVGLAAVVGLGFGLVPALQASRTDPAGSLREGGRGTGGGLRQGVRNGLVVAEVALTVLLLVGAGLVVRSLRAQLGIDPGFEPEALTAMRLTLPVAEYDTRAEIDLFAGRLIQALESQPGVTGAALGSDLPMRGRRSASMAGFEGHGTADEDAIRFYRHRVTPGFFETLGIPLVRGRRFDSRDTDGAPNVILIGESVGRRFWPGEDPLGKRIRYGGEVWRVVGMVGDVKFRGLTDDLMASGNDPDIYFPLSQHSSTTLELAIRTDGSPPDDLLERVRSAVARVDSRVPVALAARMDDVVEQQTGLGRLASLLLTLFGGVAFALGAVGIYGVLSFTVAQRRREVGIRMALGARPAGIVGRVVGQGLLLALAGGGLGLLAAGGLSRVLEGLLYQVGRTDVVSYAGALTLVLGVAALASWIPARRAARTDPAVAFREDA